jgi:putative spermidine/putrescine transport system substrate-binding protein
MRRSRILVMLAVLAVAVAACSKDSTGGGTSGDLSPATPQVLSSIGPGEGELNLVAWPGYTEDAWVKPFEQQTGCQVNVKYGNTSDDMVNLMRLGGGTTYDGVSASGDATLRLIAGGDVAPINTDLITDYSKAMPALQSPAHNTVDGVHYGVPYMWGPNFLMYNTDVVSPAPTSWEPVFSADSPYKGKVTAYDSPIYIADAALYLKAHNPELGITDPYELTEEQLNAAVDLLKVQSGLISKYWAVYTDQIKGFKDGSMVIGTAWPVNQQYAAAGKDAAPVASVVPSEGVTGWADTWMMSSHAKHPNCMYMWMNYTMQADVQAQVAAFYGATPSNVDSCPALEKAIGQDATDVYHCGDDAYLSSIALWKTPLADCGDGSVCTDYTEWTTKWTEVRGS